MEYNCHPDDFGKKENIITIVKDIPGRRIYSEQKEFFSMVTLGGNAVITADERIHPWLEKWCADKEGTSLSNLHSWNIALNCGFYPAWVEIATTENGDFHFGANGV